MYPTLPARAFQLCFVLIFGVLLVFAPLPAQAGASDICFDAGRALDNAEHLATEIGSRPAGSDGEHRAAAWIAARLANMDYEVKIEPFTYWDGASVSMNVVAIKQGQPDYGVIYIGAHYDTAEFPFDGPGANDNASGVAVLLEAAEVLSSRALTPTIFFIAFGAEESSLAGSNRFVAQMSPEEKLSAIGMCNLDCVGVGDELHIQVANVSDLDFARHLDVEADGIHDGGFGASDHYSFAAAGIPALLFNMRYAGLNICGLHYHRASDTAETLEVDALQRVGDNLISAVMQLSDLALFRPVHHLYIPVFR